MAIADVASLSGNEDTLRRSRFTADHQIVATQIQVLQCERHERQQQPVVASQRIEKRSLHSMGLHDWASAFRIVEERENVRVREDSAERIDDCFAAAPVQQPIMYDGGAHVGSGSAPVRNTFRSGISVLSTRISSAS